MNSQIYCLPQKFGWNAEAGTGPPKPKKEPFKSDKPYFTVNFDGHEVSPQVLEEFKRRYPKLHTLGSDSTDKAKACVYLSETAYSFQPHLIYPKTQPPVTLEKRADPMLRVRPSLPAIQKQMPEGPGFHHDPDRGFHTWRRLFSKSYETVWQPLVRRDWTKESSERNTLPPVRLIRHDPTHEKQRWDYARHLAREKALSYSFRRDLVGYTGYKLMDENIMATMERDMAHPNPAMESTTQAVHKEFPNGDYLLAEDHTANKHQGPMSRMVTLTHPYNPFTQQSAYSHVGAKGTQ